MVRMLNWIATIFGASAALSTRSRVSMSKPRVFGTPFVVGSMPEMGSPLSTMLARSIGLSSCEVGLRVPKPLIWYCVAPTPGV